MGWTTKQEHRTNRRVAVQMPIIYRVVGGGAELEEPRRTKSTNLSCQGVAFESPVSIPITARLQLRIFLPGHEGELNTEATLVRIAAELPDNKGYEYGLQFDLGTLTNRETLEKFVRSVDVVPLLEKMTPQGASDLHLTPFTPPALRVHRNLIAAAPEPLSPAQVENLIGGVLNTERRRRLAEDKEISFPFMIPGVGRWRVNAYYQRGFIEGTFHAIDQYIPTVTELELPDIVHTLALSDSGLVLVTGMTGSGKSSTIASMVGVINENTSKVVVTIEDPIEYVHENALSIVKQREVGNDTLSCLRALRHALRQDPDVLVIDTVPDLGTMDTALRAAEEGYLIIMSFPTPDPPRTLSRIATMYPQAQRALVLHMLAGALRGVISQKLLPRLDGSGSALACEVLVANDAIRGAIRSDRMEDQMMSIMGSVPGAQLLDVNLRRLVQRGEISYETAALVAHNPEILRRR